MIVTSQITLLFSVNNRSVSVSVFVQPGSEQEFLLGINTIPYLGFSKIQSGGQPILSHLFGKTLKYDITTVNLIKAITRPTQKLCMLKAQVSRPINSCGNVL